MIDAKIRALNLEIVKNWAKIAVGPLGLVGSNPAVGCFGQTHGGENPTPGASNVVGKISLALWMRKESYRPSTIQSCVNTLSSFKERILASS